MSLWSLIDADAGLFAHERKDRYGWSLRTVVLRLADGSLLVQSPMRGLGDSAHAELAKLGRPSVLLAPNHFHYLGLSEWQGRYSRCRVIATDTAAPRIRRKSGVSPLPAADCSLPDHARLLACAGNKAGEAWLSVQTRSGLAWVVCDAFFNVPRHPTRLPGVFCRLTGTTSGLRIGGTLRLLHLSDRTEYREWLLDRIATDAPRMLVPSHGDVLVADDLPERLRRLAEERLG